MQSYRGHWRYPPLLLSVCPQNAEAERGLEAGRKGEYRPHQAPFTPHSGTLGLIIPDWGQLGG